MFLIFYIRSEFSQINRKKAFGKPKLSPSFRFQFDTRILLLTMVMTQQIPSSYYCSCLNAFKFPTVDETRVSPAITKEYQCRRRRQFPDHTPLGKGLLNQIMVRDTVPNHSCKVTKLGIYFFRKKKYFFYLRLQ